VLNTHTAPYSFPSSPTVQKQTQSLVAQAINLRRGDTPSSATSESMELLNMTRDAFQAQINATSSSPIDKITIGAAIIRNNHKCKHILLLKRNAHEAYYPSVFEMPGGKVDKEDLSIRHAIMREVLEETNLTVADISLPLSTIRYTTQKEGIDGSGNPFTIRRNAIQLSYVVVVEGGGVDFMVNKDEHSIGIWAERKDLDRIPITKDMKRLVLEALGCVREMEDD
jgi:8-oxo-dGTP pyrophosphatase MutT (NUDIX family)